MFYTELLVHVKTTLTLFSFPRSFLCFSPFFSVFFSWPTDYMAKEAEILGKVFAKALLDPSQQVRCEARLGFDSFRAKYPDLWDKLVINEETCVIMDPRLKKSLLTHPPLSAVVLPSSLSLERNSGDHAYVDSVSHNKVKETVHALSGDGAMQTTKTFSGHFSGSTTGSHDGIRNPFEQRSILTPSAPKTARRAITSHALHQLPKGKAAMAIQAAVRGAQTRDSILQEHDADRTGKRDSMVRDVVLTGSSLSVSVVNVLI